MSRSAPASRTKKMRQMQAAGLSYAQIAKLFGLTKQRIGQILGPKKINGANQT